MAASRKWLFKKNLRARAFGWRGSKLAISRLKEAASEIRSAAKSDPVAAGDGSVWLMERIWPAFQDIDTSSGALGTAVARTLSELIPILAGAPADHATRSKWLERLFEAVQNDGVEYLRPAEERWGEIAHYPDLINKYADRLIEMVRRAWSDHQSFQYVTGTSICLSCLLEAGRYDEIQELLATRRTKFWSWHRFGAEALVRQGLWEGAIAFAEGVRDTSNSRFEDNSIDLFCEDLLIQHGRTDEAYRKYGLRATRGTTNLAIYRALVRQYPDLDRRQILLDLIEIRGDKGKWFAAAKDEGFLDIALECAGTHGADPSTLVRAARDFGEAEPRFAASVALMAIGQLLGGGGYLLPALPFIRFLFAILGWIVTVVVAVLAVTVFAAAHVTRGDGTRLATQATRLGWLFLPGLILRPPLMLFGLIVGYFVFLAGIGLFNEVWLPQMRDAGASGGLGPIGFLAMLTLYVMIAYGLMNASFKLIDLLPSAVLDWIGGRGGAGEDGGERVGGAATSAISQVGGLRIGAGPRRGGGIAGGRG